MASLFDPRMLQIGSPCPCHKRVRTSVSNGGRRVVAIEWTARRFACTTKDALTDENLAWRSSTWHWFDEAAYALGQRQEVNEWGEVGP